MQMHLRIYILCIILRVTFQAKYMCYNFTKTQTQIEQCKVQEIRPLTNTTYPEIPN